MSARLASPSFVAIALMQQIDKRSQLLTTAACLRPCSSWTKSWQLLTTAACLRHWCSFGPTRYNVYSLCELAGSHQNLVQSFPCVELSARKKHSVHLKIIDAVDTWLLHTVLEQCSAFESSFTILPLEFRTEYTFGMRIRILNQCCGAEIIYFRLRLRLWP